MYFLFVQHVITRPYLVNDEKGRRAYANDCLDITVNRIHSSIRKPDRPQVTFEMRELDEWLVGSKN